MSETPKQILAGNLRRIRQERGLTLDDITMRAADRGLSLTIGRLSDIERGKSSANLETLVALLISLNAWEPWGYTIADLVGATTAVRISPTQEVPAHAWNDYLHGKPIEAIDLPMKPPEVLALSDRRAARKLGLEDDEFAQLCRETLGDLLSVESRARAGDGASAQKLGRITRSLIAELKEAIA